MTLSHLPLLSLLSVSLMCTIGSLVVALRWAWGDRKKNNNRSQP